MSREEKEFKCWECGTKYPESFCATDDVSLCRWCSGEEDDGNGFQESGILE
jgi:DNA-directed RNA polymerase subunit RPC12/RpoP